MHSYSRALRSSSTSPFAATRSSPVTPASFVRASCVRPRSEWRSIAAAMVSDAEHPPERGAERRLPHVLGGGMPPRALVLHRDVFDGGPVGPPEIACELRVEPADRIEAIEEIRPAASHLPRREPVGTAPSRLELVLNLIESKRAADRDEAIDGCAGIDALQAVVRDHRAHAVRHDDVRACDRWRAHGLKEPL